MSLHHHHHFHFHLHFHFHFHFHLARTCSLTMAHKDVLFHPAHEWHALLSAACMTAHGIAPLQWIRVTFHFLTPFCSVSFVVMAKCSTQRVSCVTFPQWMQPYVLATVSRIDMVPLLLSNDNRVPWELTIASLSTLASNVVVPSAKGHANRVLPEDSMSFTDAVRRQWADVDVGKDKRCLCLLYACTRSILLQWRSSFPSFPLSPSLPLPPSLSISLYR
jgi:hypothetical protein